MIDCASRPPDNRNPKGRWLKEILPTPRPLRGVPRRYGRYGMNLAGVHHALASLPHKPAAFLVTSLMTYWYPGVQAAIAAIRDHFSRYTRHFRRYLRYPASGTCQKIQWRRLCPSRPGRNRYSSLSWRNSPVFMVMMLILMVI